MKPTNDPASGNLALQLTDNFPVGAYVFYRDPEDNSPRFSFLSNRLLEMLDLSREEAEADPLNIYKRMHHDDLGPFTEVSLEAARLKTTFNNESRYIVRGETKWYRLESSPRQLPDGLTVWDGAVIDVTERRLAQERERQNEAQKRADLERKLRTSLAAAAAAHEINQPLSRILLTAQLVLDQETASTGGGSKLSRFLRELANEAQSVVSTIEKMKALMRSIETARQPLDLREVVDSAILYAGSFAREGGVEISFARPSNPMPLTGDADQIQIALNNLIRNALEALAGAGPENPRSVCVELRDSRDHIELLVGDSGPGLPESGTEGPLAKSTKPNGSGLGLFIVRTAAENHGGRLETGRSPLGGAEFRMVFPLPKVKAA